MMQVQPSLGESTQNRHVFAYDALRAVAAFLVIVNHTNSQLFQSATPLEFTWWFSMAWYYFSKIAVPLFVLISGALLLGRQDSYARNTWRIARMLLVLVLFSYGYYLWDLWMTHFTWVKAFDFAAFFASIWKQRITDSFWYLYFYIGLLVMLPLLQRLAMGMGKKDCRYLIGWSLGVNAAWPLLAHYAPGLALPPYFDVPLFAIFIGLFFTGHYLARYAQPSRGKGWWCLLAIVGSVALCVALTRMEYARLGGAGKYWFMDERTAPALPVIICAMGMMFLPRCWPGKEEPLSAAGKLVATLGGCAFGIYLLQDWIIVETKHRVWEPLMGSMHPIGAVLLWEVLVFGLAAILAWLLRLIPGMKKVL